MKIVLVGNHLRRGGITTYLVTLSRELVRRGHRVLVVTGGGEAVPLITEGGAEHRTLFLDTSSELNPRLMGTVLKLRKWVVSEGWQLVHAQTRVTQGVSALALKGAGIPRVTTCHGFFKTRLFRKCFPWWGDRVIAISRAVERHLRSDWSLDASRVQLIPHGVERLYSGDSLPGLRARGREELKIPAAVTLIGALGRFSPVKGYHVLLEAMSLLKNLPVELVLIGDGPESSRLQQLILDHGLTGRVRCAPSIPNHHVILNAFDIFCAPSIQEGFGLSILDAMARGTCVVASNVGGIPDLIQDGATGRLVRPGDANALAGAIRELVADPEGRIRMGLAAKRFVEREFLLARMVQSTEAVYERLIQPQTAPIGN